MLLLVPGGREAELSRRLLDEADIASVCCADMAQLCRELEAGAGAVLLTDALLSAGAFQPFLTSLANQPVWSDLPVVLSLESAGSSLEAARAMSLLGNVTLLERPVRVATLVSVLRAALRARARQYQIRDHLSGEQQRAAAAIAASEERLRLVIDAAQDGIWDWDITQDRAFWSDLTFRLLGYEPGDLTPSYQTIQAIVHPEDAAREAEALRRHLEEGQPYSVELRMRRKDGSYGWFQAQGQVQRGGAGQPVRMVGSLHDIIRVRDTGVGIDPEVLPRIFDLFAQADQGLAHSQGGLGIGLTMVKRLVEMHGGSVEASSAGLGQGSEFVVRLPALPEAEPAALKPEEAQEIVPQGARLRIMVVDDVADSAESLAELLELWGHEARTALDAAAALDLARELRPALAILDIGMPGMDGYGLARLLRQEFGQGIMLVALTGYGQDADRRQAAAAGFDRHLTKPVDLRALCDLLASYASEKIRRAA